MQALGRWVAVAVIGATGCAAGHAARSSETVPRPAASLVRGEEWRSEELGFAIDRPESDAWAVATGVLSPDGHPIPLVLAHEDGAQIVVQATEPVDTPANLAQLLHGRLSGEPMLKLGSPAPLRVASGREASGFRFAAEGDAKGRVAIVDCGGRIVLVVASWPEGGDVRVERDVDAVVRSVRESGADAARRDRM